MLREGWRLCVPESRCVRAYIHVHLCTPKELSRHRLSVTTVLVVSVNIAVTAAALVVIYYYWSPSL